MGVPSQDSAAESSATAQVTAPATCPTAGESPVDYKKLVRRLGPAGPLALIAATLPALGGFLLLGTLAIVGPWLREQHGVGLLLYAVGFAVCAGLAILPTYAQSILGGWAFGFACGYPAAMGAIVAAAYIGYLVGLRAAGDRVVRIISEQPKWNAVYHALLGGGFGRTLLIVTLIRLPPSSPFAITNLVLAATRVHPLAYGLGTLIGLAPRTAAVVYFAAGFRDLTFDNPHRIAMWIISIVLTGVILAIIGYIANNAVTKVTAGTQTSTETDD